MVALNPQGKSAERLDMDSQFVASNFGISVRTLLDVYASYVLVNSIGCSLYIVHVVISPFGQGIHLSCSLPHRHNQFTVSKRYSKSL